MKNFVLFIGAFLVFFLLATTQAHASYWSSWGYPTAMGAYAYNYPYYGYYSYGSGAMMAPSYFNNKNMYNFAERALDKTYSFAQYGGNDYTYGFPSNGKDYNPWKQHTFYDYQPYQSTYFWDGWDY